MKEFGRKIVFLFILLMLGTSCGTSKKSSKTYRKPDIKVTPEKNPPITKNEPEQIDTISWQQEKSENVIVDKSNFSLREKSTRKDHYNVAFLAPFRSRLITSTDDLKGSL